MVVLHDHAACPGNRIHGAIREPGRRVAHPAAGWIPGTRHNSRVVRHGSDIRGADGYGVTVANRETYLQGFGSLPMWNAGEPEAPVLFHSAFARTDGTDTADQGWVDFPTWEPGAPRVYDSHYAITSSTGGFDAVAAERFGAGYSRAMSTTTIRAAQSGCSRARRSR